ncbi:MAG: acyl-CoA thioesterase [Acidimicrobiales bacterium]|jgi:acyl-CoA thioesterase
MSSADWQFDRETSVEPTDVDGVFRAAPTSRWNIGTNPNGGYAASVVMRALVASVSHVMPISATTHYLRPALADQPATVEVEVLRSGRTTSTASGRLIQDGKERLRVLASFGDVGPGAEPVLSIPRPDMPAPEDCPSRAELAQGIDLPILESLDVRVAPEWAEPGQSGQAVTGGWIRFCDGRPPDEGSLLLFSDAFPPSPFGLLGRVGWVPTLELTLHVRRKPVDGWIQVRTETRDIADDLLVEDGVLWDSSGAVVAQCRQLSLLRSHQ